MGTDLIPALSAAFWALVVTVVALDLTRKAIDYAARRRHWRVGGWGRVLCVTRRVGEECLRCRTDYRYVLAHALRYRGETIETARALVPVCVSCWNEIPEPERLLVAGRVLQRWRADGAYGPPEEFRQDEWDSDRLEVYATIKAGL